MDDEEDEIDALNREHGRDGRIRFERAPGRLACAVLEHPTSRCRIALHGATVLSFVPTGGDELFWLSESACLDGTRAIRGGVPICWPWFGQREEPHAGPLHGFASVCAFEVTRSFESPAGVGLELRLARAPETRAVWPHDCELTLRVVSGLSLEIELETRNTGGEEIVIGAALHSYFRVGAADRLGICGLAGHAYLDKVRDFARDIQRDEPAIEGEIDRVYLESETPCSLEDPALGRRIEIHKRGSRTSVLWNPGAEKAAAMPDFDDQGFREMVCLEAANAFDDQRRLAPGERHVLAQRLAVSPLEPE